MLKNMLTSIEEEAERWLGLIEMGSMRNGSEEIEGPVESTLKEKKGKEVALSGEGEDKE